MLPEQQQRIMGYFIEEAKDHLNTIEQGLISLQATIEDSEMVHEVFRAAHSVKGGAAMLGLSSIQHTAHRLEDYFKVLKECPGVKTTHKLETLFLRVFDTLHALIDQLQGPFGLTEDKSAELMAAVEPVFAELSQNLSQIVSQSGAILPEDVELVTPISVTAPVSSSGTQPQPVMAQEESAIQLIFQSDVPALLRRMLQLFKQPDNINTRDQLQGICELLAQPGEQLDLPNWCSLLETVKQSIAYADNGYRTLAPVVIKDVKQAQELVLAGRSIEIAPSQSLLDLVPSSSVWEAEEIEADLSAWFDSSEDAGFVTDSSLLELEPEDLPVAAGEADLIELAAADDFQIENDDAWSDLIDSNAMLPNPPVSAAEEQAEQAEFSLLDSEEADGALQQSGPEVGAAELTSLADLFDTGFETASDEDPDADWADSFDDSFDSPLSDMDTVLELGDYPGSLPAGFAAAQRQLEAEGEEALTLEESDQDLSDLLQSAQFAAEFPNSADPAAVASSEWDAELLNAELFADLNESESSEADLSEADLSEAADWTTLANAASSTALEAVSEESVEEGYLNLLFEEPAIASQSGSEEALLASVFGELDRPDAASNPFDAFSSDAAEADPEFFELFELELPDDGVEGSAELPADNNAAVSDFDSLFGIGELPEVSQTADDAALEWAEPFAFTSTELIAEPRSAAQTAADAFADLFEETPQTSLQTNELPSDAEVSTDLWFDAADESAVVKSLNDTTETARNSSIEPIDTAPVAIEQIEQIQQIEQPGDESPEDLDTAWVAGNPPLFETLSETFPETFAEASPEFSDAFSLEPEEPEFDLSTSEPLAVEISSESVEPLEEHFATSFNLFDSDLAQTDTEQAIADDFSDLEALLTAGEMLPSDWTQTETETNSEAPEAIDAEAPIGETKAESTVWVEDEFADLEAMLGEELDDTPITAPITDSIADIEPSSLEAEDEFADLEALLQDTPPTSPPDLDEVPVTSMSVTRFAVEDEFDDLEALIKDVDQVLGVGSSPVRKVTGTPSRRFQRRNVLNEQMMRVSVKHLDNLNNLVGEMVVNRNSLEQAQERLRQFLDNLLYQVQQLSDVGQRMRDLYERSLLERSLLSSRRGYSPSGTGSAASQTSHAIGVSFDALEIDQFTAFHTLSQEMIELIVRVRESASDIDFVVEESDQVTRNFRQITTQLQEGLTRSRMVPFAQTADRLPRGVRDNSLKYGKQAELAIEGRETLIDKMIVDQLNDPMTHLVNNAIAHGIETPEERIASGKPPTGKITVQAFHQGNQTIISVSDDGAGINPERVKAKAIERGLITAAQARELSRLDVYDLLFHHGFSTVDQADDLRGRGVGLDVVRNNLSEIRGSITIDSAIGKGTTFTIRLPLTLSISKALCCISNRARIAFPMDGVEDMFDVPADRLQTDEQGRTYIPWRDMVLPLQPLAELLRYSRTLGRGSVYGGNQEEDVVSIVVLRSGGNFLALQVDQVLGEQEIVIKQLEGPVPKPIGVAGATVLGDGRIMPIADVLELIDLWQGRIRREPGNNLWEREREPIVEESTKTEPTVLIVDDSITVRELLSMTFSKVGYRVEQARDGQEAWEKLRAGLPCNLVFCDIEMPRMDGLELLSRLQKDPHLGELPIAMLTSRGADRHKQMAIQLGAKGYFTKPYLEEVLLDAAQRMLRGEVLVNGNSTTTIN